MINRLFFKLAERWEPREGWVLFCLTISILYFAVRSVALADWVPEDSVIWVAMWSAIIVTYALVWRPFWKPWLRWLICSATSL